MKTVWGHPSLLVCVGALLVLLTVIVAACAPVTVEQTALPIKDAPPAGRIVVVESTYFMDAKREYRTIVILRDTKTGAEYLGVQGFGVMDMTRECTSDGKHTSCKTVED